MEPRVIANWATRFEKRLAIAPQGGVHKNIATSCESFQLYGHLSRRLHTRLLGY